MPTKSKLSPQATPAKPSSTLTQVESCKKAGRPAEIDRATLLDAAEYLFADKGFDGTTTREVVQRARCNLALISYYFGGKDGLYEAVLLRHLSRFRDSYAEATHTDASLARAWPGLKNREQREFCAQFFEFAKVIALDSPMQKIICREMLTGATKMAAALRHSEGGAYSVFARTIEGLRKSGKVRKDLDLRYCVVGLIGPVIYSCIAEPILKEVYGFGDLDMDYVRELCVHQTRVFFEGCGARR